MSASESTSRKKWEYSILIFKEKPSPAELSSKKERFYVWNLSHKQGKDLVSLMRTENLWIVLWD